MNREMLYREIGEIDDDLIQAANKTYEQSHRKLMRYRIAAAAACLCLISGGILFGLQRDTIYFNELPALTTSKIAVPSDENTELVPMTYRELLVYYGMENLPDTFGQELTRATQSYFVLYQDQDGNVLYDTNNLYYSSSDGTKTVSLTVAKVRELPDISRSDTRQSKINGFSILLTASSSDAAHTVYGACFEFNDVSVRAASNGLSKNEFIDIIRELTDSLR